MLVLATTKTNVRQQTKGIIMKRVLALITASIIHVSFTQALQKSVIVDTDLYSDVE